MLGFSGLVYLGLFLTLVLPLMFRVITKCSAGAIAYRASVKVLQYNVDMCIGADGGCLFFAPPHCVVWFGVALRPVPPMLPLAFIHAPGLVSPDFLFVF